MSSMYVFTPKRGKSNLSCFIDCKKHSSAGALKIFIDNRQFNGFLHKQNQAASTDINLLSLVGSERNFKRCLQFRRNSNLQYFFYFSVAKTLPKSSQACGKRRKTLKF